MADLSQLSDDDLRQIARGDLRMVSEHGLRALAGSGVKEQDPFKQTAKEQSGVQNFLAGVGGGMTGLVLGAGQRIGVVDQETVDEHNRAMAGLRSTGAGTAGDIVGTAATLAPAAFIPGANSAVGASLIGGISGALNPTSKGESVAQNMVLGGAGGLAGQKIGNALGKVLAGRKNMPSSNASASATSSGGTASASSTVSGSATATGSGGGFNFGSVGDDASAGLTQAQKELIERTKDYGFKLTPGQASGSRALQQLEAKLESQPMTSGRFNDIKSNNQRTLNSITAASIGEGSDVVDGAVLDQAHRRIGGIYKMVADKRQRPIDPDAFLNDLGAIESNFEGLANISENPLVKKFMNYAANGKATGEQLQQLSSQLGKVSRANLQSQNGLEREMGIALGQVKNHVDDLLEQGLSGETLRSFQAAKQQYRNLMMLESRVGIINPSNGNISGGALANALQQKDKMGYLRGNNTSPLYDAARFSQAFKPIVGDSGTATRMPLPSPTDFVLSLPFNIATRAYTSSPVVNLAASAGNMAQNGLAPDAFGRWIGPRLGGMGLVGGGLLGQAQ